MPFSFSPILIILLSIFSLFILISIISIIECRSYVFTFYSIFTKKLNQHFRIIFFSDFHDKFLKNEKHFIDSIINLKPDFILIGGDLINYSSFFETFKNPKFSNSFKFLKKLSKNFNITNNKINYNKMRIFFSLGNHECRFKDLLLNKYNDFENFLHSLSICILDGKTANLTHNLSITGFNIYNGYYGKFKSKKHLDIKDINSISGDLNINKFNIALLHKPDYIEDLIHYGYDLVLSGHNHGGLFKTNSGNTLFSPEFKIFPKYNYGMYNINDKKAIVTNGIGEHFIKLRINNRPEIVVIDIN